MEAMILESNLRSRREQASDTLPLFSYFFSDPDGNAWLGDYGFLGTPSSRYTVVLL